MELPLVNESSFTPANSASYSLEDFWPLAGDHLHPLAPSRARVNSSTPLVTHSLGNRDGSAEESTVTHESISGHGLRKRRESAIPPDASAAQEMQNSSSKRVKKVLELKEEKMSLKDEVDTTSVASAKLGKHGKEASEPPKQDYIRVRARRGQATDSHSLAERARREKISERMKILQDLVPGCNKIIGKSLVLDEIINYVLSLQHQVELLSMKLEAINSSIIQKDKMVPVKSFEVPGFESTGMILHTHPATESVQGPKSEGLRMHI